MYITGIMLHYNIVQKHRFTTVHIMLITESHLLTTLESLNSHLNNNYIVICSTVMSRFVIYSQHTTVMYFNTTQHKSTVTELLNIYTIVKLFKPAYSLLSVQHYCTA